MSSVRYLIACVGLCGVLFVSWWVTLLAIVLLSVRFRSWEAIVLGVLTDLIWQPAGLHSFPIFTTLSLIIVWGLEPLRLQFLR